MKIECYIWFEKKNVVGKSVLCLFVGHFSENGQCVSSLISEALQHRFLGDEDRVDDEQGNY